MQLRPAEASDRRILIVSVDEADIQYQIKRGMKLQGSLADEAFVKLLRAIAPYKPRAIGSDIVHDFDYSPELATAIEQTPQFVAICRIGDSQSNLYPIAPPPDISSQQLGFTNFAVDPDGAIRRQILGMAPDKTCQSDRSFSLKVALTYLKNPSLKLTSQGLRINNVLLPQLENNAGGYQLPLKEALGYQILINYRSSPPQTIPLREILAGYKRDRLSELVRDRIVFIGVADAKPDTHPTPYNSMPGVIVHAQMTSQLIGAVLDGRTLLWWWPQWAEIVWIGFWSVVGAILVLAGRSLLDRSITIAIALSLLVASCYLILLAGGWIPLVPSALGIASASIGTSLYNRIQAKL
jgi:CHASE2 domain-containing sensor protein